MDLSGSPEKNSIQPYIQGGWQRHQKDACPGEWLYRWSSLRWHSLVHYRMFGTGSSLTFSLLYFPMHAHSYYWSEGQACFAGVWWCKSAVCIICPGKLQLSHEPFHVPVSVCWIILPRCVERDVKSGFLLSSVVWSVPIWLSAVIPIWNYIFPECDMCSSDFIETCCCKVEFQSSIQFTPIDLHICAQLSKIFAI
jgi:hypothetical protein